MSEVALRRVGSSFVGRENGRIVLTPVSAELEDVARAHARLRKKYRSALQKLADA